jgi:hypothetical protein
MVAYACLRKMVVRVLGLQLGGRRNAEAEISLATGLRRGLATTDTLARGNHVAAQTYLLLVLVLDWVSPATTGNILPGLWSRTSPIGRKIHDQG